MDEQQLAAIEARAAAATPGPWHDETDTDFLKDDGKTDPTVAEGESPITTTDGGRNFWVVFVVRGAYSNPPFRDDMAFVAHARADVPALCAEVRRLRAALTRYTDIIDLTAKAYVEKYGATTYADAMDDFRAARAALAGEDAPT